MNGRQWWIVLVGLGFFGLETGAELFGPNLPPRGYAGIWGLLEWSGLVASIAFVLCVVPSSKRLARLAPERRALIRRIRAWAAGAIALTLVATAMLTRELPMPHGVLLIEAGYVLVGMFIASESPRT